jgi:EAL domain-containing protein (putative c-di-GMP-specific phosphodiesterase class I)/CheY-like chemotaxis protein
MTETLCHSPTPADGTAPVVEAPSLTPDGAPLCYVVDDEASIRHFLSLVLHGSGIDTMEFPDGAALRKAAEQRLPNLVFHNISLDSTDAIASVIALAKRGFCGAVQLMSSRGAAVLEHVKGIGVEHKLNMLPVLKKPFETDAIAKVIQGLDLGLPQASAGYVNLNEALENNWVEFWYQPKIALRKKQLAGAEAYARARHPQYGIVPPGKFISDAPESSVIKLAELALISVLKASAAFSKLGINLPLTVNMPVYALTQLPVEDVVRTHRMTVGKWPGLIIDVPEEQIVSDLPLAAKLAKRLAGVNVRLAIDDFGRGYSSLARLGEMPFAELKLDRAFVTDCATDKVNAPLCKTVINLAHNFGRTAVAMGIEKAADAAALVSMGCDYGQGFLLGQPMPEQRFLSLLRQRANAHGRNPPDADE